MCVVYNVDSGQVITTANTGCSQVTGTLHVILIDFNSVVTGKVRSNEIVMTNLFRFT